MTFPPCSLALGMRERYAMQCAKVFENLFTSNQSKGEVTVGLEVSLDNGLLQKVLMASRPAWLQSPPGSCNRPWC